MKAIQKASLLKVLHATQQTQRAEVTNQQMHNYGLSQEEITVELLNIQNDFDNGIGNLNANQLESIFNLLKNHSSEEAISQRLNFFEIDEAYQDNIIRFFNDYRLSYTPISVNDLETSFHGVQVATRDDFNSLIAQGWTGDWIIDPKRNIHNRLQIASFNDTGNYIRGWYINADIIKTVLIPNGTSKGKYEIHFTNPQIINSGNRNVKFRENPVAYL